MPILYFTTVNRRAAPLASGELVKVDWERKTILARAPMAATDPVPDDPKPQGSTRGGRGIAQVGDRIYASTYHSVKVFDANLEERGRIDNGNFVNLHEVVATGSGDVLVTATGIDAVLRIDPRDGGAARAVLWPREMPGLRRALDLTPLTLDKAADNRTRFLDPAVTQAPGHVHLNAVAVWDGRVHALLSRYGVIADLDRDRITVRDPRLRGAHNLVVAPGSGHAYVNDTRGRTVRVYDLAAGTLVREYALVRPLPLRLWLARLNLPWFARCLAMRLGVRNVLVARPFFARGLALWEGYAFVGVSPAAILMLDLGTGAIADWFVHTRDVAWCVHGLAVEAPAAHRTPDRSAT
jgi:hypothetical protein